MKNQIFKPPNFTGEIIDNNFDSHYSRFSYNIPYMVDEYNRRIFDKEYPHYLCECGCEHYEEIITGCHYNKIIVAYKACENIVITN